MLLVNGIWSERDSLWPKIVSLAKQSSRRQIVVAYLGKGASKILPLRKGNVLVVDLSEQAVKTGQTDPSEVEKYLKKGVKVYSQPNLHAKLYVFDEVVIVSSANLSTHSRNNLIEVGLLSEDKQVLSRAKNFIEGLIDNRKLVKATELKELKKLYRSPRFPAKRAARNFWISRVDEEEFDDPDNKTIEKLKRRIKHVDVKMYDITAVKSWGRCAWNEGDIVVQVVYNKDRPVYVIPPSEVIKVHRQKSRVYCLLKEPKHNWVNWNLFQKVFKKTEIKQFSKYFDLKVTVPQRREEIYQFWENIKFNIKIINFEAPSTASIGQSISIQLTIKYSFPSLSCVAVTVALLLPDGSWKMLWHNPDYQSLRSGRGLRSYSATFIVPSKPGIYRYKVKSQYWDGSQWKPTDEKFFSIQAQ
jgi:ribosomal protein L20